MDEIDAKWGVDKEGLSFLSRGATGRGVADMSNSDTAGEAVDDFLVGEDISDQAIGFVFVKFVPIGGDHAGRVLTTMLQHEEAFVDFHIGIAIVLDDTDDAAHSDWGATRALIWDGGGKEG